MFERFHEIREALDTLEAVIKPGPAGAAARERALEAVEKTERDARFDRALRALCNYKFTA